MSTDGFSADTAENSAFRSNGTPAFFDEYRGFRFGMIPAKIPNQRSHHQRKQGAIEMNFRIKLTLTALAAFILMSSATTFAAPSMDITCIRQTTGSDIPWPPPGNPADPTDPNNGDDYGSDSGSSSGSGCDCGHDHGSDSDSDNSYPDNPYDPNNDPMPN